MHKLNKIHWFFPAVLIFCLGVLLRLYHLGTESLDIDEMVSVGLASRHDWGGLISDTNPPLFLLFSRYWLQWTPHTEFWIRFPAFLASCSSLLLMLATVAKNSTKEKDLVPLILLAISPLSVEMGQWARGNAFWELATLLCLYGVVASSYSSLATGALVGAATHWFSLPLSFGFLLAKTSTPLFRSLKTYAFLVFLVLFFVMAARQLELSSVHLDWQVMRFRSGALIEDSLNQLDSLFGSRFVSLLLVLLLAWQFKVDRNKIYTQPQLWFLFVVLIFCLGLITTSLLTQRALFLGRYINPVAALLCWSLPPLIQRLTVPLSIKRLFFTFWILTSIYGLYKYSHRPHPVWRPALQMLKSMNPKTVWTTRSIEIAHPYLEGTSIEVLQFQGRPSDIFQIAHSAQAERVAVIDNFWGGLLYWDELRAKLMELNLKVIDQEIGGNTLEPIRLMLIENPAASGSK